MASYTREVKIGNVSIGNGNPTAIQSMCNTDTRNPKETIEQIHQLENVGCEIVRVAVPDMEAANSLKEIRQNINIPLVADIHFNYKLALEAANYVDKLRINPGNIGSKENVKKVVDKAKDEGLPIRIGVNSGSIEKDLRDKPLPEAMVESASRHIEILENLDFYEIVVSLKASEVGKMIQANKKFSERYDYPLHLGVTEAGTAYSGSIKSALGIGHLLLNDIGDTIRVSLSAHPTKEVLVAKKILQACDLRQGPDVVSCPTCGRTDPNLNVFETAKRVEENLTKLDKNIKVAVMGCAVNGPGEAKEADVGVAGAGGGKAIVFKKGKVIRKINAEDIYDELMEEIKKLS